MKRSVILSIAIILLVGINFGYYQPKITSLEQTVSRQEARISTLESEKSTLEQTVAIRGQTITHLEQTISTRDARISTLSSDKSKLETDLSQAQAQAQTYIGQVNTLTSEVSSSKQRLDNVLGITVTQGYQWTYQGQGWDWTLPINLSVYLEYHDRPRTPRVSGWVNMAKDPKDDVYIDQMVQKINEVTLQKRFTEVQTLNFVADFVQSLPYTADNVTTSYNEYPRYPIETLFDRGGDCEDTSILVAALLDRMGYDVALLSLPRHMAVGVAITNVYGSYYEYKGKKYYYLETTGEGWQIGEIPADYRGTAASIYPLRS